MKTLTAPAEQRFLLHDVDWRFYDNIVRGLGDRPVFVTYDRGSLEIMSPSPYHENCGRILGAVIQIATLELGIPMFSGGATTFRREDLDRGIEPDECYWIQSESRVRGMKTIDLATDPPPDLVIEIEISRRLLDREGIFAALCVPELWRYDGERLRAFVLGPEGRYQAVEASRSLPMLPLVEIERHLSMRGTTDQTTLLRAFRDWVRSHLQTS